MQRFLLPGSRRRGHRVQIPSARFWSSDFTCFDHIRIEHAPGTRKEFLLLPAQRLRAPFAVLFYRRAEYLIASRSKGIRL